MSYFRLNTLLSFWTKKTYYRLKSEWKYHEIFSFLEAILKWYKVKYCDDTIYIIYNSLFEKECVGYRFINGEVTDIIDEEEIREIE